MNTPTQPPGPPRDKPPTEAPTDAAPEADRTEAAPDTGEDDERTLFAPSPPAASHAPGQVEGQAGTENDDRTVFGSAEVPQGPQEAQAGEEQADPDATIFSPNVAPEQGAGTTGGDEATLFAGALQTGFMAGSRDGASSGDQTNAPPPPAPMPMPSVSGRTGMATVKVGTLINNNYEVKEVLKAGGMGEVYRGENVITRKPVAIKVVLPELAEDEKVGLMFLREATTLSELSDEAIVGYQNFIKDPITGRYCLIMDFISGVPLSEFTAKNGAITEAAGRTLMKRLAKGLEKAHARDVIHRDLSPDNVMLPDGVIAEALLIDFGIAKSSVVKEGTMAGHFAGKFKFVSPEQLGHFGGKIGPATDIYGLALLMAAALRGKPLDMGGSIVEAVDARREIPDLSGVPDNLRPLLAHMLEPDPACRPTDMARVGYLLDHPEEIAPKYNDGVTMAPLTRTSPGGSTQTNLPQALHPVSGLQTPPTATPLRPGVTSLPPQPVPREKRGGGVMGLLVAVFLAAMGGAGYYAWSQGLLGNSPSSPDAPAKQIATGRAAPPSAPTIQPHTREGFLAGFDTGPCTYADRISVGANAGMVQGFASRKGLFAGLPTAYEEKFGARPTVLERLVTSDQCAPLEFARSLQGRGIDGVHIRLDTDQVASGAPISGQIIDPLGRKVWLVLISPKGGVYNLTSRLSDPVGERRSFHFALALAPGAEAAPQLLLAVATGNPLVNAAAARDGSDVKVLLPLIAREIAEGGGKGVAALSHILLTQPAPAPTGDDSTDPPVEDIPEADQ